MVARNTKLTDEEVRKRFADAGYEVQGPYQRKDVKIKSYCKLHDYTDEVVPNNIFRGGRMKCCGKESMRTKLSAINQGSGNSFFGRKHSIESKDKMSRFRLAHPEMTKPFTEEARDKLRKAMSGKKRPGTVKEKLRKHMLERHRSFPFIVRKARSGKTAGKTGIFYAVKIGDLIKLGSATTTMGYRMSKLRQKFGPDIELVGYAFVDNAGEYEAKMMENHAEHWSHGEYFHDWTR